MNIVRFHLKREKKTEIILSDSLVGNNEETHPYSKNDTK